MDSIDSERVRRIERATEPDSNFYRPWFTPREVQRLRFTAYRLTHGYLRPPAPLRSGTEALCAEIAAYLRRTPAGAPVHVPLLWQGWTHRTTTAAPRGG